MTDLTYFKIYPEAIAPLYATEGSACFDLSACLREESVVIGYTEYNEGVHEKVTKQQITIYPGERLLVPTGLILGIPQGHSVRLHPRSGLSYKKGIILANCEGVIDSDYTEQLFVLLTNISKSAFIITHGDRVAQAELQKVTTVNISETSIAPIAFTSRNGGLGSTGL